MGRGVGGRRGRALIFQRSVLWNFGAKQLAIPDKCNTLIQFCFCIESDLEWSCVYLCTFMKRQIVRYPSSIHQDPCNSCSVHRSHPRMNLKYCLFPWTQLTTDLWFKDRLYNGSLWKNVRDGRFLAPNAGHKWPVRAIILCRQDPAQDTVDISRDCIFYFFKPFNIYSTKTMTTQVT